VNVDAIRGLSQPDQRSCGPSSLVAARILMDPAYAATQNPRAFAGSVLALHRQLTGSRAFGRAQLPWPRALGTPPWAVARAMSSFAGVPYTSTLVPLHSRSTLFSRLSAAVATRPAPFYVGDWIPRHVVLAVAASADGVQVYNPAHGGLSELTRSDFEAGRLTTFGRWTRPWFVVLPAPA
jgi:hypothetical protein